MGKVLIIKNNDKKSKIYKFAEESYSKKEKGFYNTIDDSENEKYIKIIKDKFEGDGFLLLVTYDSTIPNCIQDVFIGSNVSINEYNNIEYFMKIHLSYDENERTIKSILDKIDLDISKDFDTNCYVTMNNMDNLYQELRERIFAHQEVVLSGKNNKSAKSNVSYELNVLAQKDEQAVRIYPSAEFESFGTEFQRDRERVVNCKAFRRLVDKAQIFSAEKGDYFRTRMTHSLEVNQIAKAISFALHLNIVVEFSPEVDKVNSYLERVVQKKVICNTEVARADYNASMIVKTLFEKYYANPRLLHGGTIHKIFIETLMHRNKLVSNSAINLNDGSIELVNDEIKDMTTSPINKKVIKNYLECVGNTIIERDIIIFEKRKILIRSITDYIAGMTDGYALEEFEKLK